MSRLQQGDVVCFDTPYGWVGTVAQYDRDLPRGAMLLHPGPFLTATQDEVDQKTRQGRSCDYTFQLVTKRIGERDESPTAVPSATGWLLVRDIHTPHEPREPGHGPTYGYADEGFYTFSDPTLMHRVAETDNRDLAEVIVEHDPDGSTLDEVLVEHPGRAA